MALTNRQTIAVTLGSVPVPPTFVHEAASGKPAPPDTASVFTADPATDLLSTTAHGLVVDDRLRFTTAVTLPAGLSLATDYYVIASGLTVNAFKVSLTSGGSAVDITDAGTGTHSWTRHLTAAEQAEVDTFKAFVTNGSGRLPASPVLPQAISLIAAFGAYHQSPAYRTWWHDDQLSRAAQYQLRRADMYAANDLTVPPSADPTGAGSSAPSSPVPRDPT